MKNAFVTQHHFGDNGDTPVGAILPDISEQRFQELERKGLVREATAAEVKEGFKPPFTAEEGQDVEAIAAAKKRDEPANKKAAEPANKAA